MITESQVIYKSCTSCKKELPATMEFFHKNGKEYRYSRSIRQVEEIKSAYYWFQYGAILQRKASDFET